MKQPKPLVLHLEAADQLIQPCRLSPFLKRRIHEDAEKFLLDQTAALPRRSEVELHVHLPRTELGVSAEVIDVATLRPLDFDTIAESVSRTGRCVIVQEAPRTAGFGAEIAARLAEQSMYDLVAPVERVTGYDTHIPLFRLEMKYLPSVERIVAAARRAVAHA